MEFEEQKTLVLHLLKAAGLTMVYAEYSGSGDDGQFDGAFTEVGAQRIDLDRVEGTPELDAAYAAARLVGEEARSLAQLVEDLCYAAVDNCGHGGFHNNEGGYGVFTIDVEACTCMLEHTDYVQSTENHTYEDL